MEESWWLWFQFAGGKIGESQEHAQLCHPCQHPAPLFVRGHDLVCVWVWVCGCGCVCVCVCVGVGVGVGGGEGNS